MVFGDEKKMSSKLRGERKTRKLYTKGELNKLIDGLCHPLFKTNKGFMLVDGLLHAMVEQNPPRSVKKFMKYNLPKIVKQITEKSEENQRQT